MSKLAKRSVVTITLILLAVAVHFLLRSTSPFYNFVFSPADLHAPLTESDFDVSEPGNLQELEFTTKYPGNHRIALVVENPPKTMMNNDHTYSIKITISAAGETISESLSPDTNAWFHGGPWKSGVILKRFSVPDDLPLKQTLLATIKVLEEDQEFSEKYGKHRLVVNKYSDE